MKLASILITTFCVFFFLSCQNVNKPITTDLNKIAENKQDVALQETDSLGAVIAVIDFKLKVTGEDLKTFEDGFIPWISIANPQKRIKELVDPDEIVLPFAKVKIFIDYPLNTPAIFEVKTTGKGFSRKQLITEISKRYHEIYALEERTASTKTVPIENRAGLINRNQTDGKFGVWGHDITDLDLSQIEVHQNSKGEITLTLVVES